MSIFEVLIMLCLYMEYMSNVTCSGLVVKARSHSVSMSAVMFSKIIEAMVRNENASNFFVPILCLNINLTIDTMLKFDTNVDEHRDFDARCG